MSYNPEEIREKYKELFEHSLDFIYVIDSKGNILDANDIMLKRLEYKRKELIELSFRALLDEEDLRRADNNVKEFIETGQQSKFSEYKVRTKSGDIIYVETFGIPLRKNGEIYSILGIAKDITDLKNAQESLKRSEKKYRDLFETTPFSIVLLNSDGIIVDCNPTLERVFGYKKIEIIGRHFGNISIVHQDFLSYLQQLFIKILKGEEVHRTDLQMYKKDGALIWTTIQASIVKIGGSTFVQVVIYDITKRKNLTQQLLESENLYKTLVRTSPNAIVVTDLKGKVIDVSQKAVELYGGDTMEDLIGKNYLEFMIPEDQSKAMKNIQKTLKGETVKAEYKLVRIDGTYYICELNANLIKDADGNPKAFIGIMRDITEQKLAEKKLKESEEQYRHLYKNAPISLWTVRISDGKFIRANENAAKIVGYDNLDDFLKKSTSMDVVPGDYRKDFMAKLKEDGEITGIEAHFTDKKGNEKYITMSAKLYEEHGYFEGVSTDITEFKKIQNALQESEEKYRHLFENFPNMILLLTMSGDIVDMNKPFVELFGIEKHTSIGHKIFRNREFLHKNKELFMIKFKEFLEYGYIDPFEVEVFDIDRSLKWINIQASVIEIEGERLIQVILQDINERKQAEQLLKESEEKYRHLFEKSPNMLFLLDLDGTIIDVNTPFIERFVYKKEELIGKDFRHVERFDETNISVLSGKYQELIKNGYIKPFEFPFSNERGETRWLNLEASLVEIGNRQMVQVILQDIHERKQAEQKIKESEKKYRTIIEDTKDGYFEVDLRGNFTFFNDAFCKLFEYPPEELMGMNFKNCTTEEMSKKAFKAFNTVYKTGIEQKSFEYEVITKNGNIIYGETPIHLIYDAEGNKVGFSGFLRDVTEKKIAENKLRESEEKYRLISENANDFIAIFSQLVKFEYVNEVHMKVLGYSYEDLIGKSVSQFIHPRDIRIIAKILSDLVKFSEGMAELRFKKKDGTYIWLGVRGQTFLDKNGEIKGIIISRNITEKKEAEQKLKESEEQYRTTINSFSDPLHVVDRNLKIILANPVFERWLIGLDVDENIIGKNVFEAFPFLPDNVRREYEKVFNSGIQHFSEENIFLGNKEIITETRKIPIFKGENVNQVVTILRDITEKKEIENKLRTSETKYRHLFESAPFLIGLSDLDGKVLALNSATNQFLTTPRKDDLIGKNFREIFSFHEEEKPIIPKAEEQLDKLLRGEVTDFFEFPLVKSDGSIQWVNLNLSLINIENETLIQLILQDITERKKAEQNLKKSEEKFRRIFESIPDLYFMVSKEGEILDYRGQSKDLYLPPEDFLGKSMKDLFPGDFGTLTMNAINNTIETKQQTIIEYTLPIKDEMRYFESRFLYFSKDRVAVFIREITERKKAELIVEEEFKKLKELEQIRKDLISRASHELKTPLIPVISGSELLKTIYSDQLGKDAREIIEMIDKGGRRLKDLVDQLLNVSRIEYDKLQLEKQKNNLSEIVKESSNDMKYLIKQRKLTLSLNIPEEFWLKIDKNRIGEVITNLLSNAIKYTPPNGKITIKLYEQDDWAILSVIDTGVGLTEKEMKVLFTRFGKIDRYTEGLEYIDIKGSGLGLYICKEILKLHGGQIWAESDGRNKGSTFMVKLPID